MKTNFFLFFQWTVNIITVFINFALTILIANKLEPEKFGLYSLLIVFASLGSIFMDLGAKNLILSKLSTYKNLSLKSDRVKKVYLRTFIFSLFFFTIIFLFSIYFLDYDKKLIFFILLCFFLVVRTSHKSFIFKSIGNFKNDIIWQALFKIFQLVSIVGLFYFIDDVKIIQIFLFWIFSLIISNFFYRINIFDIILIKNFFTKFRFNYFFNEIKYFAIIDFFTFIYLRSSFFILEYLDISRENIGIFSIVFKNFEAVALFITPLSIYLYKKIQIKKNISLSLKKIKYISLFFLVGIIFSFLHFYLSNIYLEIFFSSSYGNALQPMKLLSYSFPFVFINSILSYILLTEGKQKFFALAVFICSIINLLFNFYYIPADGILASIVAIIITEFTLFVLLMYFLIRK